MSFLLFFEHLENRIGMNGPKMLANLKRWFFEDQTYPILDEFLRLGLIKKRVITPTEKGAAHIKRFGSTVSLDSAFVTLSCDDGCTTAKQAKHLIHRAGAYCIILNSMLKSSCKLETFSITMNGLLSIENLLDLVNYMPVEHDKLNASYCDKITKDMLSSRAKEVMDKRRSSQIVKEEDDGYNVRITPDLLNDDDDVEEKSTAIEKKEIVSELSNNNNNNDIVKVEQEKQKQNSVEVKKAPSLLFNNKQIFLDRNEDKVVKEKMYVRVESEDAIKNEYGVEKGKDRAFIKDRAFEFKTRKADLYKPKAIQGDINQNVIYSCRILPQPVIKMSELEHDLNSIKEEIGLECYVEGKTLVMRSIDQAIGYNCMRANGVKYRFGANGYSAVKSLKIFTEYNFVLPLEYIEEIRNYIIMVKNYDDFELQSRAHVGDIFYSLFVSSLFANTSVRELHKATMSNVYMSSVVKDITQKDITWGIKGDHVIASMFESTITNFIGLKSIFLIILCMLKKVDRKMYDQILEL